MTASTGPRAEKRAIIREHHGDRVADPYEWLRDTDSPEVVALLQAENAHTDERTAGLEALRRRVFDEIRSRTLETDISVPQRIGQWWYFTRTREGAQYGISCRTPAAGPDDWTPPAVDPATTLPGEQIVFDSNEAALGNDFFALGSFDISADGRRLLYGVDTAGDERYTLRVRDLASGDDLPDEVGNTFSGAVFSPDGAHVFYTTVDDAWRPDTVHRHRVGSAEPDVVVLHEPDERFWVGVDTTRSQRYILFSVSSSVTSEYRFLPATTPTAEPRTLWPRREEVEYDVEHAVIGGEDVFLVTHNDGAEDFEVVAVDPDAPGTGPADARVVVPHRPGVRIEDVEAFADRLVVSSRREGLTRIAVARLAGVSDVALIAVEEVVFPEPLYTVGTAGNPEWTAPLTRLSYTSMVTPRSLFELDAVSGELTLLKRQPVLGGYDPDDYEQLREWAPAPDGTLVPISIVKRRDTALPAPLELYGYGSYELSTDPGFSIARLSLLDRGAVFAIAHVRGGGELGRSWYEDGKRLRKRTSFTDFVAAAEHLIARGYTVPERLVAEGGSAGGLLMGAVANLAPTTFAGILASVPFVDALTSILKPELPLTVIEWDEWGDPLHDAEVYDYIKGYTPYENVVDGADYPRILVTTSLNDTRVLVVEPVKWVQRLRDAGADPLLRIEMSAGHGGVTGRYDAWRERAEELAWILDVLGLADAVPAAHAAPAIGADEPARVGSPAAEPSPPEPR
ncbi:S9 family peptidase [Mycetocola reblochoni]|uniref:Protease II n=2 Tax=Mycetocola reblochoni TaxID=331618 RepID=A0A1R4K8L8_9MICO|nr:S9 family peptidase [Mycetocola reblochoni]RLP68076.1 S9 family peptidase [Mycetocola reblochoni]SJN40588.1 Protease II [Mycetocola reblochoni REB411]